MPAKSKKARRSAQNGAKNRVRPPREPPEKTQNVSLLDEANIIDTPRRAKPVPSEENIPFEYNHDQKWNCIFSTNAINQLVQLIPCQHCGNVGFCRAVPTSWAGWVMYYSINCVQKYGGCGYQNYFFTSNDQEITKRAAVAMKISGIRRRQMQRLVSSCLLGVIDPYLVLFLELGVIFLGWVLFFETGVIREK